MPMQSDAYWTCWSHRIGKRDSPFISRQSGIAWCTAASSFTRRSSLMTKSWPRSIAWVNWLRFTNPDAASGLQAPEHDES